MTAKHMCVCVSQNARNLQSWKKKRLCPFPSSKPRPKKGKKAFSCDVAADLTSSNKGSFYKTTRLQDIKEHECKPDTSEKQSDFASIFTDLDRIPRERCFFYCVTWNCFLQAHKTAVASSEPFCLHRRRCPPELELLLLIAFLSLASLQA